MLRTVHVKSSKLFFYILKRTGVTTFNFCLSDFTFFPQVVVGWVYLLNLILWYNILVLPENLIFSSIMVGEGAQINLNQ